MAGNTGNQVRASGAPTRRGRSWEVLVVTLAFLLVYPLLYIFSLVSSATTGVLPWFLPSGLSLALLLYFGERYAPALFITAAISPLILHFVSPDLFWVALLIGTNITVIYTLGAAFLRRRLHIRADLARLSDSLALLIAGLCVPLLLAISTVAMLRGVGSIAPEDTIVAIFTWWFGDTIGIFTLTPLLLVVVLPAVTHAPDRPRPSWRVKPVVEGVLWLLVSAAIVWTITRSPVAGAYHLNYLAFLPIFWIALRHGLPGSSIGVFLIDLGIATAQRGTVGEFTSLPDAQFFLLTIALVGLLLGSLVSQYRRVEQELHASEEHFRLITETAMDAIITIDEGGRIVSANAATERVFGYARHELLGQPLTLLMPPRLRRQHEEALREYLRTGIRHTSWQGTELPGLHRDGYEVPLEITYGEFTSESAHRFAGILRDITERKQAEEQLRIILDTVPALIFFKDTKGIIQRVNRAFANTMGVPAEELIGLHGLQYFHPEDLAYYRPDDERILTTGESICGLIEPLHTMQGERWLQTDKIPCRNERGEIIGLIGFALDITERRRAEEAFEYERAFLSSAIDLLPFPIFFFSAPHGFIRDNRANREFLEAHHAESWNVIEFATPQLRIPIPHEQRPGILAFHGEVISSQESVALLPDGMEVPVLVHAAPVFIDERLIAAVVAVQDITRVKEADRAKNQFLNVLSHELKTPLTSIIGWTQAAQDAPELVPQALEVIERNAQRQRRMLDDLLDLTRLLHGKLVIKRQPIDLWSVAIQSVDAIRQSATEHGLTLLLAPPAAPLWTNADSKRLGQVLTDLLDNSIKFTPAGGTITVAGAMTESMVSLSVHDTGRGIAPQAMQTLFEPFTQVERLEQAGGLGMGLMLARGIVELHGGTVTVESPGLGQGSTFTIQLPRMEPPAA